MVYVWLNNTILNVGCAYDGTKVLMMEEAPIQACAQIGLYLCRAHAPLHFQSPKCCFGWWYNFPQNIILNFYFVIVFQNPRPQVLLTWSNSPPTQSICYTCWLRRASSSLLGALSEIWGDLALWISVFALVCTCVYVCSVLTSPLPLISLTIFSRCCVKEWSITIRSHWSLEMYTLFWDQCLLMLSVPQGIK